MTRLSIALIQLKGKQKQTKDESARSMSSATQVAASQLLQNGSKPPSGAHMKTSPTQPLAQDSHGLNPASKVTTSTLHRPTSVSGGTRQSNPPCKPILQSTKDAPPVRSFSKPVSTFTEAALQHEPQPALIESPKKTPQSDPQHELSDAEVIEDQFVVPKPPGKVAQQPSSSRKVSAVNPQPQPTTKPTVTAPKAKPRPVPRAKRQTPKRTSRSVSSIPKPAIQTHAGLYSGFNPSVAAVDQPTPKTLSNAQKAALDVLRGPLATFRTGGPLGGGQYSSTGGAIGGGTITQTGGRFGEGSVSKTGGSLGEALGLQGAESRDELEEERLEKVIKILQDYYLRPPPGFAPERGSLSEILGVRGCDSRDKLEERLEEVRELLQDYYLRLPAGFVPET